jgi:hypothetical protein
LLICLFIEPKVVAAQDDLCSYLPSESELKVMFPWGQAKQVSNKIIGDAYTYENKPFSASGGGEIGRANLIFQVERYIDAIYRGKVKPRYIHADSFGFRIEFIEFTDGGWIENIRSNSVEKWRSSERGFTWMRDLQFIDVKVGDKAYLAIWYEDLSNSHDIFDTKGSRLCFIKGNYYVQVHVRNGTDEKLIGTCSGTGSYQTTEAFPTQYSVVTAEKTIAIARMVESRLSGQNITIAPIPQPATSQTAQLPRASQHQLQHLHLPQPRQPPVARFLIRPCRWLLAPLPLPPLSAPWPTSWHRATA